MERQASRKDLRQPLHAQSLPFSTEHDQKADTGARPVENSGTSAEKLREKSVHID